MFSRNMLSFYFVLLILILIYFLVLNLGPGKPPENTAPEEFV